MVFSSLTFLFLFLPVVVLAYHLLPQRGRNPFLVGASLLFYAWGEAQYLLVMVLSIAINWAVALCIEESAGPRARRHWLILGVGIDLGMLGAFKYLSFVVSAWGQLTGREWLPHALGVADVHLPIGISFFTFQAIAYLADVHGRVHPARRSLLEVALYISFFPQLIAGPIVRLRDIASQLTRRNVTIVAFASGVERCILGLGKKVLLADPLAPFAGAVFTQPAEALTPGTAWLGTAAYALQIYFDFSGYSDMAIGLGRMFGFEFPENFRHPYRALSVREFWRRWHITLSTWFRDYVYVPLGGSRRGAGRVAVNLCVVFLLCGFWHGASWNFLIWGAWHGLFLSVERLGLERFLTRIPPAFRWAYTAVVTLLGWVVFRAADLGAARRLLAAMLFQVDGTPGMIGSVIRANLDVRILLTMSVGLVLALGPGERLAARFRPGPLLPASAPSRLVPAPLRAAAVVALFWASLSSLLAAGHSPFIYFRF